MLVSPKEFERQVFELEHIRIIVRVEQDCPMFESYDYKNRAPSNFKVTEWLEKRILSLVGNRPVAVIRGNGQIARGQTTLDTVRNSYH